MLKIVCGIILWKCIAMSELSVALFELPLRTIDVRRRFIVWPRVIGQPSTLVFCGLWEAIRPHRMDTKNSQ